MILGLYCIRVDRPKEWPECHLYGIGDLHLSDPHNDYKRCAMIVEQIRKDPYAVAVLNGDIMNTAVAGGKSDIYDEKANPDQTLDDAVGLFKPIAEKIIGVSPGNHELRIWQQSGFDTTRQLAERLGVVDKYHRDGVLVFLRFGETQNERTRRRPQWYSIYATHGRGGGKKVGGKANRLEDMLGIVDADIYIHSHTHQPMVFPLSRFRVSASNSTAEQVDCLCLNTSAAVEYGGYAQQFEYRPASRQFPVAVLYPYPKLAVGMTDFHPIKSA